MEALRTQWELLIKLEGKKNNGYACYHCVVSVPHASNPTCMALVTGADDWNAGHFGGRADLLRTEQDRDYYQVTVYVD
jgi:hypothetical protein